MGRYGIPDTIGIYASRVLCLTTAAICFTLTTAMVFI